VKDIAQCLQSTDTRYVIGCRLDAFRSLSSDKWGLGQERVFQGIVCLPQGLVACKGF